ncbi:hypothetical protein [Apis mellifera associated microvirus 5]|nr:hypothetical protein [Apis mellifera associated microvirus 5]AZL82845.1 hypothetical protein [Apis mellifera associated microvirus 5]
MRLAQFPLDVTVLVDTACPWAAVSLQLPYLTSLESIMSDRFPVSRYASARSFERSAGVTRVMNVITPLRGGWRL